MALQHQTAGPKLEARTARVRPGGSRLQGSHSDAPPPWLITSHLAKDCYDFWSYGGFRNAIQQRPGFGYYTCYRPLRTELLTTLS